MLVKQSFTTHIWWYIPSIYGDLGDGLLLFYILPTLLAFLKRYWRILYASVRSIICLCIYWYTAMAFNTVTTSTTYRYHSIQYQKFMEDIFTVCFFNVIKPTKKTCNNISHVKHHSKSVKKTHCFTKVLSHRRRTHFRRPTCHAGHPRLHLNSEGDCLEGGMVGFILK